jgi:toxin CcdB
MQHEVHANPAVRTRRAFPFVVELQADVAGEGRRRLIAPLAPAGTMGTVPGRLLPIVRYAERDFHVVVELIASWPLTALRRPLGSVASYRYEITRALDWLFTGV